MDVIKIDDHTLQATMPQGPRVSTYDYGFLKQQLVAIEDQRARDNAQRDTEIAEVIALIAEADRLGLTEKSRDQISTELDTLGR